MPKITLKPVFVGTRSLLVRPTGLEPVFSP